VKTTLATPSDSRYVPLTQQASCCVPTCIQMVMYKLGIPLLPAEEIGYHLGLVVRPEDGYLFYDARISETPPSAGYGTRIYEPEFELNTAFKNMGIPLTYSLRPIQELSTVDDLVSELKQTGVNDSNALLCFNHGALIDDPNRDWGHVVVFDRIVDGKFRIIDPSPTHPKWRLVEPEKMFNAMKKHGEKKTASGVWTLTKS
jgi:hypothetical protein